MDRNNLEIPKNQIKLIESIYNVNKNINKITQSKQFIRWFGDWQNSPAKASKAVDSNS